MKYLNILLIALLASLSLAACDVDEGPMEETGESVDQSVDEVQDATDDATDDVQNRVD